jgi:tetratricopeptide (TPR) repeat protein
MGAGWGSSVNYCFGEAMTQAMNVKRIVRSFCIVAITASSYGSVRAEDHYLVVVVENLQDRPIPKVVLKVKGYGFEGKTDETGTALILLAPEEKPGNRVTLQILQPDNLVFISPYNGQIRIPPFERSSQNVDEILLGQRGTRELLENKRALFAIVSLINDRIATASTKEDRARHLVAVAEVFGVDPLDMHKAIMSVKVEGSLRNSQLEFYKRHFESSEKLAKEALEFQSKETNRLGELYQEWRDKQAETTVHIARSLYIQGKYREAAEYYQKATTLRMDDAKILGDLAMALYRAGEYVECENLYGRLLDLIKNRATSADSDVGDVLNNLAEIYRLEGKYVQAEQLYDQSLTIKQRVLKSDDPSIGETLNNKASLYFLQKRYAEAEPLLTQSMEILRKAPDPDYLALAANFSNLASLYYVQDKKKESELFYELAFALTKLELVPGHPLIGDVVNHLGIIYFSRGDYKEAERLYKQSLDIFEKKLGPGHINVALALNNLAETHHRLGKLAEAEATYLRALRIFERVLGRNHFNVAAVLTNLGTVHQDQHAFEKAEQDFKDAIMIFERAFGKDNPSMIAPMNHYATLLRQLNRSNEAQELEERAKRIWTTYNERKR